MKIIHPGRFWIGILILFILAGSYFIYFQVDSGAINSGVGYNTQDSLLGIFIFHNAFILALYILISIALIISGLTFKNKGNKNKMKGGKK